MSRRAEEPAFLFSSLFFLYYRPLTRNLLAKNGIDVMITNRSTFYQTMKGA